MDSSIVSSWIDHDFKVCYQLMQTNDFALFDRWTRNWSDLMEFEVVPVRSSAEAVSNYCPRKRVTRLKGYQVEKVPAGFNDLTV